MKAWQTPYNSVTPTFARYPLGVTAALLLSKTELADVRPATQAIDLSGLACQDICANTLDLTWLATSSMKVSGENLALH